MGKFAEILDLFATRFSVFRRTPPVRDVAGFEHFLATRAAFISQKTLFGYVKTRMGLQYPERFQDDVFIESLDIAKWNIYAACLSDLAVYMAARVHLLTGNGVEPAAVADRAFTAVVSERFADPGFKGDPAAIMDEFRNRLELENWPFAAEGEGAFRFSPKALVYWAPIADELKKYDGGIVRNSIRFQWQRVRSDFAAAFDADAFLADWRAKQGSSGHDSPESRASKG